MSHNATPMYVDPQFRELKVVRRALKRYRTVREDDYRIPQTGALDDRQMRRDLENLRQDVRKMVLIVTREKPGVAAEDYKTPGGRWRMNALAQDTFYALQRYSPSAERNDYRPSGEWVNRTLWEDYDHFRDEILHRFELVARVLGTVESDYRHGNGVWDHDKLEFDFMIAAVQQQNPEMLMRDFFREDGAMDDRMVREMYEAIPTSVVVDKENFAPVH